MTKYIHVSDDLVLDLIAVYYKRLQNYVHLHIEWDSEKLVWNVWNGMPEKYMKKLNDTKKQYLFNQGENL